MKSLCKLSIYLNKFSEKTNPKVGVLVEFLKKDDHSHFEERFGKMKKGFNKISKIVDSYVLEELNDFVRFDQSLRQQQNKRNAVLTN
jgi:hypothetical protein